MRSQNWAIRVINAAQMQRTLKQSSHGDLGQLFSMQPHSTNPYRPNTSQVTLLSTQASFHDTSHPDLLVVLEQFQSVFVEPKELPPTRTHDHHIPLKPGCFLSMYDLIVIHMTKRMKSKRL